MTPYKINGQPTVGDTVTYVDGAGGTNTATAVALVTATRKSDGAQVVAAAIVQPVTDGVPLGPTVAVTW